MVVQEAERCQVACLAAPRKVNRVDSYLFSLRSGFQCHMLIAVPSMVLIDPWT